MHKYFFTNYEYFWEYEYPFGEDFLKNIFEDNYKRKYSLVGDGIFNLVFYNDKIYSVSLKQGTSMLVNDGIEAARLPSMEIPFPATNFYCSIAQLASAPDSYPGGHKFKSYWSNQNGGLTQLIECYPCKVEVAGLSPASSTILKIIAYCKESETYEKTRTFRARTGGILEIPSVLC